MSSYRTGLRFPDGFNSWFPMFIYIYICGFSVRHTEIMFSVNAVFTVYIYKFCFAISTVQDADNFQFYIELYR